MSGTSMRLRLWAVAIAVIALALGAGAGIASSGSSQGEKVTRLRFLLTETFDVISDVAPKGPSKGDLVVLHGQLLDPKTKKVVGYEGGHCTNVDSVELRGVCEVVFTPGATRSVAQSPQITAQAFVDNVQGEGAQLSAVTGGTGKYSGARGQIIAKPGPSGSDPTEVTFELR